MTLVFERIVAAPATHAFVIGCGRFPHLKANGAADRQATVAGAREFVRFLHENRNNFEAPLASIECLISEMGIAPGADTLGLGSLADDQRPPTPDVVDAALSTNVETAGETWLNRCRPGDHMLFYMASHGVAESNQTALGLLEDIKKSNNKPWANSLNVSSLATGLPHKQAGACWVFLDACQELVDELNDQPNGAEGISLISTNVRSLTRTSVKTMGLVGARFGKRGWALNANVPPFFTQALIYGMQKACVEPVEGKGWTVTAVQIHQALSRIAEARLGYQGLETESLGLPTYPCPFMKVVDPEVPVIIRSKVESHLANASSVAYTDAVNPPVTMPVGELSWRFVVRPDRTRYTATAELNGGPTVLRATFVGEPPAQIVVLQ
jgi:hypothetical protein